MKKAFKCCNNLLTKIIFLVATYLVVISPSLAQNTQIPDPVGYSNLTPLTAYNGLVYAYASKSSGYIDLFTINPNTTVVQNITFGLFTTVVIPKLTAYNGAIYFLSKGGLYKINPSNQIVTLEYGYTGWQTTDYFYPALNKIVIVNSTNNFIVYDPSTSNSYSLKYNGVTLSNAGTNPQMVECNNELYFWTRTSSSANNLNLFKYNGSSSSVVQVSNAGTILAFTSLLNQYTPPVINNCILFESCSGPTGNMSILSYNLNSGSTSNMNISYSINSNQSPINYTVYNNRVYYNVNGYSTDGLSPFTYGLSPQISPLISTITLNNYVNSSINNVNNTLVGSNYDAVYGQELWKSDGTSTGTVLLADINKGTYTSSGNSYSNSSNPRSGFVDGNTLYFVARVNNNSSSNYINHIWQTDGTTNGTIEISQLDVSTFYNTGNAGINNYLFARGTDGFLYRIKPVIPVPCFTTRSTETITACNSYTWHGKTYTSSNNTDTFVTVNVGGCDSVITLNLTIACPPQIKNFSPTNATTGDTITIKGLNFVGTTAVSFGDPVPATSYIVLNDSTIKAVVPSGKPSVMSGKVFVTTPGGVDSLSGFVYTCNFQGFNPLQDTLRVCGDSVTINAGSGFSNYSWTRGDSTSSVTLKQSGFYRVTVTNSNGCNASDSCYVSIVKAKILNNDTTICKGSSITLSTENYFWKLLGNLKNPIHNGASFIKNGKIVIQAGASIPSFNKQSLFFDLKNYSSGTINVNIPFQVAEPGFGVINNKLYVTGGYDGNAASNYNQVFDILNNQWSLSAIMPTSRSVLSSGVINNELYVVGGWPGTLNTFQKYNPVSNIWTTLPPVPTGRGNINSACVLNNKLYFISGKNDSATQFYNKNEVYDPVTNIWSTKAKVPVAVYGGSALAFKNKIYYIGGTSGTYNDYFNNIEKYYYTTQIYNPISDTWTFGPNLPIGIAYAQLVNDDNSIYLLGGLGKDTLNNVKQDLSSVYLLSNIKKIQWSNGDTTTTTTVTPTTSTTYYLTVTDGINICTDSIRVIVLQPQLNNISISSCNKVVYKGIYYTKSTIVIDTVKSAQGCDSIYNVATITVTPIIAKNDTFQFKGCDSVVYNNSVYYTSKTWVDSLKSVQGCDSVYRKVIVTITSTPSVPIISSNSPVNVGDTIKLYTNVINGISYLWSGPSGFTTSIQNPILTNASLSMAGSYQLRDSINGCKSLPAIITVVVNNKSIISGSFATAFNKAISNVTLNITGGITYTGLYNTGFNFNLIRGNNYTLRPSKNNDIKKSNGVSTIDIALIQSHILQKNLLSSPYKIIAADVDNNGLVNTIDIVYIKRLILGLDTTFKGNRLWAFVDSSYTFPNPTKPFPYKDSISFVGLSANQTNQSFIGVKLGDVNYDWNNTIPRMAANKPVELFFEDVNTTNQDIIKIPIIVKQFNKLIGIQFTLHYPNEALELISIQNNILSIEYAKHPQEGAISFVWNEAQNNPITLEDGSVLFEMTLKKKANLPSQTDIQLTDDITTIEAVDADFKLHNIIKTTGTIFNKSTKEPNQTSPTNVITKETWEVSPNPTDGKIQIRFQSKKAQTIQFQLTNESGKIVFTQKYTSQIGENTVSYNLKQLPIPSGIFFFQAFGLEGAAVKKLVIE